MAIAHELPHSFAEALNLAKALLSKNALLVKRSLIDTEAEQIVIAAFKAVESQQIPFTRVELYSRIKDRISNAVGDKVLIWAMSRAEGKPLQHIIGFQMFLDHEYEAGPDVLVPRQETELLVSEAIKFLEAGIAKPNQGPDQGIEIGLGSGVISIELLARFSSLRMAASDLSAKAIKQAERNAKKILGPSADRLITCQVENSSDVLGIFHRKLSQVDFIISNPPYLIQADEIDEDVRKYEPEIALFAPSDDPLFFYREILNEAPKLLKSRGAVFLEVPHERAVEITLLLDTKKWEKKLLKDLTHRDRVLVARLRA